MFLGNKSYTVGKSAYLLFIWSHICKENKFVVWAAEFSMGAAPLKNLPDLLCQRQTAYSANNSCLVLFVGLDNWIMKKQDILVV